MGSDEIRKKVGEEKVVSMVGLLWLTVLAVMMLHTGCFSTHRSVPISESLAKLGLNVKEYPDDDFSHILGVSDPSHEPSKLQNICRMRLETVERYKTPVDRDGCGIDWSMYISADDYLEDINDFDERYGKPIDLAEQIMSKYPMAIAAEFKKASPWNNSRVSWEDNAIVLYKNTETPDAPKLLTMTKRYHTCKLMLKLFNTYVVIVNHLNRKLSPIYI